MSVISQVLSIFLLLITIFVEALIGNFDKTPAEYDIKIVSYSSAT